MKKTIAVWLCLMLLGAVGAMAEGVTPDATPEVQTEGIMTLESRRTFGGTLAYGGGVTVEWSGGIEYTESQGQLGALRHVYVYASDATTEVVSQDFSYNLAGGGGSAELTISFTVRKDGQESSYRETFVITPDGDGARVSRVM